MKIQKLFLLPAFALPLLMAGSVLAADAAKTTTPTATPPAQMRPMHRKLEGLPEEKANLVREAMQKAHEQNKDLMDKSHKMREELNAIIAAETFDKDAYIKKNEEIDATMLQFRKNASTSMASALEKLTAAERKNFAENMMKRGPMGGPKGHNGKRMMDPAPKAEAPKK